VLLERAGHPKDWRLAHLRRTVTSAWTRKRSSAEPTESDFMTEFSRMLYGGESGAFSTEIVGKTQRSEIMRCVKGTFLGHISETEPV
jgi:hypothetical protein